MAVFGSFEYGTSIVYGSTSAPTTIENVTVLDENKLLITFTNPVVIDDNLLDINNYTIEFADNPGFTDILPRSVAVGSLDTVPNNTNLERVTTTQIELVTDYHTQGQAYRITVSNLVASSGGNVPTSTLDATARFTKVDSILRSLPPHFNHSQSGILRSFLVAIGLEDDRIGGSLNEEEI